MNKGKIHSIKRASRTTASFFVPKKIQQSGKTKPVGSDSVAIIIPTYNPEEITYNLVKSIVRWYPDMKVVVVDDHTSLDRPEYRIIKKIKAYAERNTNVYYLRTPQNKLKAGALNTGIGFVMKMRDKPSVVITSDDDVQINKNTLIEMVKSLHTTDKMGAVCTQARVKNRTTNILTRLQALEYHSFTVSKIADHGFLSGPLVMQGMLTAFRAKALRGVKGYKVGHLIEDYEITVRLKKKGWDVGIAKKAVAWTKVPENFSALWRQRVRWGYGGLQVVLEHGRAVYAVFQDLLGHSLFLLLFSLIVASFLIKKSYTASPYLIFAVILVAVLQFVASLVYNAISLLTYEERDRYDVLIRVSVLPEFVYSNLLSLVLIGSYFYLAYNKIVGRFADKTKFVNKMYKTGLKIFNKFGYSSTWGTRFEYTKERGVINS